MQVKQNSIKLTPLFPSKEGRRGVSVLKRVNFIEFWFNDVYIKR